MKYSEGQIRALLEYLEMIREYSPTINLVSAGDMEIIVERHLLDSLLALTVYDIATDLKVADVGSGAGFPGIPIAIMRPDLQVYLIESRRKKSLFLSSVLKNIGLANAIVINDRWENLSLLFDLILARAIFPEDKIVEQLRSALVPGGAILYFAKYNNIKVLKPRI